MTLLDIAEIYGPFVNEELVGKAIAGRRDDVVLATKLGQLNHRNTTATAETVGTVRIRDSSPENIQLAVEGSLRRLGTDHIDLYYQHQPDPKTPIKDTMGALAKLVTQGKSCHYRPGWAVRAGSAAASPGQVRASRSPL
ncbi:aldo/keto reductase [Streptomyces sp. NPDC002896]|uniref:aldo/keto reductase n=1 Tax=Streptomyces sp. NPDC002896 TaxID=3154438 RepID=UPI0033228D34